ncbi:MAG: hypothetical protein E6H67_15800 [Betaproteobacteria bacterium]|nr:MAG: hypothetical protein E6H67_15800 [Betaproteobacteria bacterium]
MTGEATGAVRYPVALRLGQKHAARTYARIDDPTRHNRRIHHILSRIAKRLGREMAGRRVLNVRRIGEHVAQPGKRSCNARGDQLIGAQCLEHAAQLIAVQARA